MTREALSEPNMIPIKLEKRYPESKDEDITDAFMQGYLYGKADRPTGEWVKVMDEETPNVTKWHYECDQCGAGQFENGQRYCSRCGAKMGGNNHD